MQIGQLRVIEPGAATAGVAQHALRIVIAEQQRAEAVPRAARVGKADHDEFVALVAFDLEPVGAAARPGTAGRARFAIDAFELEVAGVPLKKSGPRPIWWSL